MTEDVRTFQTLSEWAKNARNRKTPKYLIYNILPADNLILLSGVPKNAQKTFLAMTAALIVATGKSVGNLKPPKAEPVLYIYEEGDLPGTLARFDALAEGHGFGPIDDCHNLFFAHRYGFSLENEQWMQRVTSMVERHGIKLVVIDTLAKCMQGDENTVQACGAAIRATMGLRNQHCSVMFVHHTRKESYRLSNGGFGTPEPDFDIRGSSALCGAYETHWAVRKYPTSLTGDMETWLMVGGKEFSWRAFHYGFHFESADVETQYGVESVLHSCRLVLDAQPDMPYVEEKKQRTKKKDET